jgi:hypothetical protein
MTHPVFHAESSVRLWGGQIDDYLPIHDWLDATKECFADFRHRALRHHAQGIFEAERLFGHAITNSAGRVVPVRTIAEQHIKEDCGGRIPSVADWLGELRPQLWMSRGYPVDARSFSEDASSGEPNPPAQPNNAAR